MVYEFIQTHQISLKSAIKAQGVSQDRSLLEVVHVSPPSASRLSIGKPGMRLAAFHGQRGAHRSQHHQRDGEPFLTRQMLAQ
jgi:hypothetical protein